MDENLKSTMVVRTSDEEKVYIWQEIQAGRLRQGWGIPGAQLVARNGKPIERSDWVRARPEEAKPPERTPRTGGASENAADGTFSASC